MTRSFTFGRATPMQAPEFRSLAEAAAMREGLAELLEILSWARPHDSDAERDFVRAHVLAPIRELGIVPEVDGFGNVWARVQPEPGDMSPCVLWSCHVDTVHAKGGRQSVQFAPGDGRTIELVKRKPGWCLGADDGAGVWLLLEMMRAGVPGGYVFHRGEEKGRLGSEYVAKNEATRLKPYDACVAFDRRGYGDLITHQMGMRCASEAFADGLSSALNDAGHGLRYIPDDTGSYTDSYSYADLVAECCNISVGYDSEHGPLETLDGLHLWRLREAIVTADLSGLPIERDPSEIEYSWGGYGGAGYGYGSDDSPYHWGASGGGSRTGANAWRGSLACDQSDLEGLIDLIRRYPAAVADLLQSYGLGADELLEVMTPSEQAQAVGLVAGGWHHD